VPLHGEPKLGGFFMEEIWVEIQGWPEYEVSNFGRIKRIAKNFGTRNGKILLPTKMKNGYLKVALCRNAKRVEYLVHRLVAINFIGNADKLDVCHIDGSRDNNIVSNLRIDTRKGNMNDARIHGTLCRGTKAGANKYSEELILKIKEDFKNNVSVPDCHKKYNIPVQTLYGIRNKTTWAWL
jgi:hypothetical protein